MSRDTVLAGEPSWEDLLVSVASGQLRVVLETPGGQRAVLVAEHEWERLRRAAGDARDGQRARRVVLTPREQEVLGLVAAGASGAQAATTLGVATNTVAQHLAAVRRKYGVRSSAAAVEAAREDGQLDSALGDGAQRAWPGDGSPS